MANRKRTRTGAPAGTRATKRLVQRRTLLDAAAKLVSDGGTAALTLRTVADAVGASTTIAYTAFGGKAGLLAALRDDAYERLAVHFEAAPRGRAIHVLRSYMAVFRGFAVERPEQLALMASGERGAKSARASRAYRMLADEVRAAIAEDALTRIEPEEIADALWACAFGLASLEVGGYFADARTAEARFTRTVEALLAGFRKR